MAAELIKLVLLWRFWVHRRVETIQFLDASRIRRQISTDFTLPETVDTRALRADASGRLIVPLALMTKRVLLDFQLCDAEGIRLTSLTRQQNGLIAYQMLLAAAGLALDGPVPVGIGDELLTMAVGPAGRALSVLQAFASGSNQEQVRQRLTADPTFQTLAADLARNFLLLTPLPIQPGERRVVELGYDEAVRPFGQTWYERASAPLGFTPYPLAVPFFALGRAESYHIETAPADGLFVERAVLWREEAERREALARQRPARQAHIYLAAEEAGIARDTVATLEIAFNIHPSGFAIGLGITSAITTALLWGGFVFHLFGVHPSPDSTPAVVIVIPGIFSAYLVRPGEHELVRRMFMWLRAEATVMTFLAFGAASILAVQPPRGVRLWAWVVAMALSSLITASFASVLVLGWRRMRNRDPDPPIDPASTVESAKETRHT